MSHRNQPMARTSTEIPRTGAESAPDRLTLYIEDPGTFGLRNYEIIWALRHGGAEVTFMDFGVPCRRRRARADVRFPLEVLIDRHPVSGTQTYSVVTRDSARDPKIGIKLRGGRATFSTRADGSLEETSWKADIWWTPALPTLSLEDFTELARTAERGCWSHGLLEQPGLCDSRDLYPEHEYLASDHLSGLISRQYPLPEITLSVFDLERSNHPGDSDSHQRSIFQPRVRGRYAGTTVELSANADKTYWTSATDLHPFAKSSRAYLSIGNKLFGLRPGNPRTGESRRGIALSGQILASHLTDGPGVKSEFKSEVKVKSEDDGEGSGSGSGIGIGPGVPEFSDLKVKREREF